LARDKSGRTPKAAASEGGHWDIVELLTPRVGGFGDVRRFVFEGAKAFSAEELRQGLQRSSDFFEISHQLAPQDAYLEAVAKKLQAGYQHQGFPEAQVTVKTDVKAGNVLVKVTEGPRYVCGAVKVTGTQKVPAAAIVQRLTVAAAAHAGERVFDFRDKAPSNQALDESGAPTDLKAMTAIGVWDAFDPAGSAAISSDYGLNGLATGESWLQVGATGDDIVRLGIADERGDGRPDYAYQGWVLYADTVQPLRLPASGGAIVIHGMGFRSSDTVQVGGQQALITSIAPNEITAIAPAAATGVSGSVDVEVDDLPIYTAAAVITGGISYDSGSSDALTLLSAPVGSVPIGVPEAFSVIALGSGLAPAGGVSVTYTLVSGTATLDCGQTSCTVTATGDGRATINVTATSSAWSIVTASLTNGSSLKSEFYGGTPPTLTSLSPMLSLAAGATVNWTTQSLVLSKGLPASGQTVAWTTSSSGIAIQSGSVTTNANGIAAKTLTVGPLTEGQTVTAKACLNGTSQCITFTAFGARPEYASLEAVSGVSQSISITGTASQITLRVLDMDGNPMAGAAVALYQAIYAWAPPCPAHGRCDQTELLASQVAIATSALDGTVTFTPASLPGVATDLLAQAVTGNTATVSVAVEQHP